MRDWLSFFSALSRSSPFLTHCLSAERAYARTVVNQEPALVFDNLLQEISAFSSRGGEDYARFLRIRKRRVALLTGLADLSNSWSTLDVAANLSRFATTAVAHAVQFLERQAIAAGELEAPGGLFVLGLGKWGGAELNYSSDIDFMVLFDPARLRYVGRKSPQQFCVQLVRTLIRLLEERGEDGYVFRTDLRLRPDPASTPLALTVQAAETYYESVGQNWERAALIKARVMAGDSEAGRAFLDRLRPFIWRKHLDFAALADIHSIKRQIHAVKGHGGIAIPGHNIKLGRGGIREIEFFVQTQQLIWGGRLPGLRLAGTTEALRALVAHGLVTEERGRLLEESYWYLRHVEHRLQMREDQQSHTLPIQAEALAELAFFCGHDTFQEFATRLTDTMRMVEEYYVQLFEEQPSLGRKGNLVFTGTEDDPETIATLSELGYEQPSAVASAIRDWHRGRYRAMRSARARELMTELVPSLVEAFSRTSDPGLAFRNFDAFLSGLPSGVQVLSLLKANAAFLEELGHVLGDAPLLAERLSHHPALLEAMIGLGRHAQTAERLASDLAIQIAHAAHYEEKLLTLARWTREMQFGCGLALLDGSCSAVQAGQNLADIADVALGQLLELVTEQFSRHHGRVPGEGMAIVALGRLGERAMTLTSDFDLIFLYDFMEGARASSGPKPLPTSQYYGRLAQRIIGALDALALYPVDMRLRPSGANGPIATSLPAFLHYQTIEAWTWEHMALTKARAVAGSPPLRQRVDAMLADIHALARDTEKTRRDIVEMRRRVAHEFPPERTSDIKHRRGGEMDAQFLLQYCALTHLPAPEEGRAAAQFWQDLQQYQRLFAPEIASQTEPHRQELLARRMEEPNAALLVQRMDHVAEITYKLFSSILEPYEENHDASTRR
ncbi:MAG TPA: bifunctional [glutamine synthetase] adenylyltransferase/[glutamine synthetase]-adenylyl-L-tyrosine phosphorylase [Dongiaceae bacterium]|nr:bifunctional [glutamine synthetase] adenylyltransferase/[glutamine synthetase]-adenylyl-L-tyrosine phosphorylase [Dongiaceae bacterium]